MSQAGFHVAIAGAGIAVCGWLRVANDRISCELTGGTRVSVLLYSCIKHQSLALYTNYEPALQSPVAL